MPTENKINQIYNQMILLTDRNLVLFICIFAVKSFFLVKFSCPVGKVFRESKKL